MFEIAITIVIYRNSNTKVMKKCLIFFSENRSNEPLSDFMRTIKLKRTTHSVRGIR